MASPGKKSTKLSGKLVKFDKRIVLMTFKLTLARQNNVFFISYFQVRRPRKNAIKETGTSLAINAHTFLAYKLLGLSTNANPKLLGKGNLLFL